MPELNFISTDAQDTAGSKALVQQPYYATVTPGYNYGGNNNPTGTGFMEFGSGTPGSLPFKVDQDGNVTAASFTGLDVNSVEWVNVVAVYGADPTGATDSTTAIQAALTAAQTSGGAIYIPKGTYLLNSALTYTSNFPLSIFGDGMELTKLAINNSYAGGGSAITITMGGGGVGTSRLLIRDLSILSNVNVSSKSDAVYALNLVGIQYASVYNVQVDRIVHGGQGYANQAIVVNNCTYVDFERCYVWANVNSFYITGTSAVVSIRESVTGGLSQQGVSTAAGILCDGTGGTIHLNSVVINSNDRGILSTANVTFWELYDVEVNNCVVSGIDFENGSQIWAVNVWISIVHADYIGGTTLHGLIFGSSFVGNSYWSQLAVQGYPGHSIYVQGGSGHTFAGATIGNAIKATANTYDEIHLNSSVSDIIISDCFFNVTPNYSFGSTPPRSAIYNTAGTSNISVSNNVFASSGYGTTAVLDLAANICAMGNIGWKNAGNPSMGSVDFTNYTITGTSYVQASKAWTIPAYDAQVGTVYRVTIYGTGIEGSTSDGLNARVQAFGTTGAARGFASGVIALSTSFAFKAVMEVQVTSIGSAGTAIATTNIFMSTGVTGAGMTTSNSASAIAVDTTAFSSINTQSSATIEANLEWVANTGNPTITIYSSTFERIGQ